MNRRAVLKAAGAAAMVALTPMKDSQAHGEATKMQPGGRLSADESASRHARWIEVAESLKPRLNETAQDPISIVKPVADSKCYLRWRMDIDAPGLDLPNRLLRKGDHFILDFGGHRAGHLRFRVVGEGPSVDSPVRLKFTFGEVPGDVAEPLYPYHGDLSSAWLPEDTVTIDFLPQAYQLPRRYAFRYVKVDVIDTSPNFGIHFFDTKAVAVTSVANTPSPLPASVPEWIRQIDAVSTATLRDCMQTVFEDGPRRDQRLWIGDLRLQARANYVTYRNYALVKRCLYLFAGLPRESDGFLPACVFEKPFPTTTATFILDYAALYGATVLDYLLATRDIQTAKELWPVAYRQIEILLQNVDSEGVFQIPAGAWAFIDWNTDLDRHASMQGLMIYACRQLCDLAGRVGDASRVATILQLAKKMAAAARDRYYDPQQGVCVSGPSKQISWASQAWMGLSGCLSKTETAQALRRTVLENHTAIQPTTPYLYHHVAEAMIECGMKNEALDLIRAYWGGMVEAGADTFWEAYDPGDSRFSPYGDVHINSFCHAWSCTPAYFFRGLSVLPG